MAQLNFSFNTPNYISEEFGGNVLLSISFPSEGYHLVMIEASNDQENWSRIQSEVISLSKEFKFIAPSKSALYRIRCKDEPESATIQETRRQSRNCCKKYRPSVRQSPTRDRSSTMVAFLLPE